MCFSGWSENQDGRLASDWLRHFRGLLWIGWMEFNETWQEARSQHLLDTKFVFFGPIRKLRWQPLPLIGWDIFDFSSKTTEQNSTKLDRMQDLNILYQISVFQADLKNKMATLVSVRLSHFRLLLSNHYTEFKETWKDARSQRPLPSSCITGQSENDGSSGLCSAKTFSTSPLKPLNGCWQVSISICIQLAKRLTEIGQWSDKDVQSCTLQQPIRFT